MPRSPSEALEPDHAPEPPPGRRPGRQHPILAFMNTFMTLAFVGLIGLASLFYFVRTQFDKPGPLTHATVVAIPKGEGLRAIAARLERESIISDQRIFVASAMYFRAQSKLKAGEYAIKKAASIREVLDTLVEGKAILYSISIPEGLTSLQVVERLNQHPELVGEVTEPPAEGSLLPDTYKFARGTTREDLIRLMQSDQKKFLDNIWDSRQQALPVRTREEALILASIVEKETGRADERPRVAAVFLNRLKRDMRLQSDPTIIYGLVGGKASLGRGILRSELAQATPYNTYQIKGLPPTPIANPGRAAIEAVLRPADTRDLYFVADGGGGHAFAESYEEHQQNVVRWREVEKEILAKREAEAKAREAAQQAALAAEQVTTVNGEVLLDGRPAEEGGIPLPVRRPATP